jgi:hypothetical protein
MGRSSPADVDAALGATNLTWSPYGRRIAYTALPELRVIDIGTEQQEVLATYRDFYGIGPVWLESEFL